MQRQPQMMSGQMGGPMGGQMPPQMNPQYRQQQYRQQPQYTTPQRRPNMPQQPGRMPQQHLAMQPQMHHGQPMHPQRAHARAQGHMQHMQPQNSNYYVEEEQRRLAQMKKHYTDRPTDLNLPAGVDKIAIGDDAKHYQQLRDFERRLDSLMTRKDIEYSDRLKSRSRRTRKMRIWISNTAENQPWQGGDLDPNSFDFKSDSIATYKVKITGRLHDEDDDLNYKDEEDKADTEDYARLQPARTKLSHFFKQITVEFDRSKDLQPDGTTAVEWTKPPGFQSSNPELPKTADFDTLEFERKSDENINCTIHFYRDLVFGSGNESDEMCSLSDELAWIVGTDEATRGEILEAMYAYIKAEGLQHDEEKRTFQCDDKLRKIFGNETVSFPALPNIIINQQFKHAQDLKPISLPYTIRVDPEFQSNPQPTVYDVHVPAEDLLHERLLAVRELNPDWISDMSTIKDLDRQLGLVIQRTKVSKARHVFYRSMEKDPVSFIKKWNSSQSRDLQTIIGDSVSESSWYLEVPKDGSLDINPRAPPTIVRKTNLPGDEWRRGGERGIWGSQGVKESVALMVSKGKNLQAQ